MLRKYRATTHRVSRAMLPSWMAIPASRRLFIKRIAWLIDWEKLQFT